MDTMDLINLKNTPKKKLITFDGHQMGHIVLNINIEKNTANNILLPYYDEVTGVGVAYDSNALRKMADMLDGKI